jgi:hypothetical protein
MLTVPLACGYTYCPVIRGKHQQLDEVFHAHLDNAYQNGDPLSKNYTLKQILRMQEYGYIYNQDPTDLVYMVGLENFQDRAFRIESRLYVHPNYRRRIWRSPDNYEAVKLQININIGECDFLFKSRTAVNPAGFAISARLDAFFGDWTILPSQIELRYPDNWQHIMYKNLAGDPLIHIERLCYQKGIVS